MSKLSTDQQKELRIAFEALDENKDGFINRDELTKLLKNLGDEINDQVIDEMMKMADTDNDGKVCFTEFCNAVSEGN